MSLVKSKGFWIGAAAGYFLLPYATKHLTGLLGKVTGGE